MNKLLHKLSHLFGFNETYRDTYLDRGFIYTGNRCATCNKIDNPFKIALAEDFEAALKIWNNK